MTHAGIEAPREKAHNQESGLGILLAAGIGGILFTSLLRPADPAVVGYYIEGLTAPDQCLDGTAYDPDQGAIVTEGDSNSEGHPTVVVSPENTAAADMTLLFEGHLDNTGEYFTYVSGDASAEAAFKAC